MSLHLDTEPAGRPIIDAALDECTGDHERVLFLRSQNDALRAANIDLTKLIDRAVLTLHEHGLHADADDIERLSNPF